MRPRSTDLFCFFLISSVFTITRGTSRKFLTPAFRGRGYGASSSDEVSRRIAIGKDGSMYIAGTTTVKDPKEEAWGEIEGTKQTDGADIFIAKLAPSGRLKWVKRIGTNRDDFLNDLKLFNNDLYLCGTTFGDLGSPVNGSSDAFVMKFSTTGEKLWQRAFQFGSDEGDSCNGIDLDGETGVIYAVGSTQGKVFESSSPSVSTTHEFIVKLVEPNNKHVDVEITRGRQRHSASSSSTDAVVLTKDHAICMTTNWNSTYEKKQRVVTYLSRFDKDTLHLHSAYALSPRVEDNFHGTSMDVVPETGDVYLVGTTNFADGKQGYYALAHSPSTNNGTGGVMWESFLGFASPDLRLKHHSPSITADPRRGVVYVAGTEEGVFFNNSDETSGVMVLPFFEVNMSTGVIAQRWQRATPLSTNRQELTDLAHNGKGTVLFTGLWNEGPNETTQALVGSYGSIVSRKDGSIIGDRNMLADEDNEEKDISEVHGRSRMFLMAGLSLSTLFLLTIVIAKCRARRDMKFHQIEDNPDLKEDKVLAEKKQAIDWYREKPEAAVDVDDVVIDDRARTN